MKNLEFIASCHPKCDHGICKNGVCFCDDQWTGVDCSQKLCLPGCDQHGVCNKGLCECNQGWNGENCYIGKFYFFSKFGVFLPKFYFP